MRQTHTLIGQALSTFFITIAMLAMVEAHAVNARTPEALRRPFAAALSVPVCGDATCSIASAHLEQDFAIRDPQLPQKQFGIYLNSGSASDYRIFRSYLRKMESAGVPAFVFDVKDYYVYFASNAPIANEIQMVMSLYDLPDLVERARDSGFYTIARYVAAKDMRLVRGKPEVQLISPSTGEAVSDEWVDPGHQTVLNYNREILNEVVASGVDEINLDFIRYPTEKAQSLSHLSVDEKATRLESFITMVRGVIGAHEADTKLGISTFAILGWEYENNLKSLGQDFVRFAPLVDVISPMAYPALFEKNAGYYDPDIHTGSRMYSLVRQTLEGYRELLGEKHAWKIRPWIQGYFVSAEDMRDQMQAVYDSGSCGYTIWSQGNFYNSFYRALPRVQIPERCIL